MHVSKYEIFRGWKVLIEWAVYIIPYLIVCVYIRGAWVQILPVACHAVESAGLAFTRLTAASQPDCMWDLLINNEPSTNHRIIAERDAERDGAPTWWVLAATGHRHLSLTIFFFMTKYIYVPYYNNM